MPGSNQFGDIQTDRIVESGIREFSGDIENLKKLADSVKWIRKLNEALFWFRQAREASSPATRFLASWISIETICSKSATSTNWLELKKETRENDIFTIREVCSRIYSIARLRQECHLAFRRIQINNYLLPEELQKKIGVHRTGRGKISLIQFLENINEVINALPTGNLKDRFRIIESYLSSPKQAAQILEDFRKYARDEILYIYRLRNKIAHDGNASHSMLGTLESLAHLYAQYLLAAIRRSAQNIGARSLDEILVDSIVQYDVILKGLQEAKLTPLEAIFDDSVID